MAKCDAVVLLYDGPASSSHVQPIFQRLQSEFPTTPCVVVHTKADLPESKPLSSSYASKRKNVVHTSVSLKAGRPSQVFSSVVTVAVGQQQQNVAMTGRWKRRLGVGITLTVIVGGLFLAWRSWRK